MIELAPLPATGFLRLKDVLKLVPISRSSFLQRVKDGDYPQPHNLGPRTVAWRIEDIITLIERLSGGTSVPHVDGRAV